MLRIIDRIAKAIPKSAIEIAAITLLIAAILYAFEISAFSLLPESEAKSWLHVSEWLLFGSAILLAIGLAGEWPESKEWKEGALYKAAKWAVIIGVVGELLGDGGVFKAGDRVEEIADDKIVALLRIAPRILPDSDQKRIRDKLKSFEPLSVAVGTTTPLSHAFDIDSLATQIAGIFTMPGWRSNSTWIWSGTGDDRPSGVEIGAREGDDNAGKVADILVEELKAAGIDGAHRAPKPFAPPKGPRPPTPPPAPPPQFLEKNPMGGISRQQLSDWLRLPDVAIIVGTKP
jgi:hypothetical protein